MKAYMKTENLQIIKTKEAMEIMIAAQKEMDRLRLEFRAEKEAKELAEKMG